MFVDEQGVDAALEFDQEDTHARHLLALRDGAAVGTLRLRWPEGRSVAKIERIAVLPQARRANVGRALIEAAVAIARSADANAVRLHAQTAAEGFYARLGFVASGPAFMEDGIPHVAMQLSLRAPDPGGRLP